MTTVQFDVIGVPAPQGSKTRMPNGVILEGRREAQRARHRSWRDSVATAAREASQSLSEPLSGPITASVTFRFPMPQARPKRLRLVGHAPKTTTPDLSKILRATEDALVDGGLIVDDRLIWRYERLEKLEIAAGWTGATITLTTNEDEPQEAA